MKRLTEEFKKATTFEAAYETEFMKKQSACEGK